MQSSKSLRCQDSYCRCFRKLLMKGASLSYYLLKKKNSDFVNQYSIQLDSNREPLSSKTTLNPLAKLVHLKYFLSVLMKESINIYLLPRSLWHSKQHRFKTIFKSKRFMKLWNKLLIKIWLEFESFLVWLNFSV